MAGKATDKGKSAIEMIDKFPKSSTRTLSKMLYEQNTVLFKDYEDARTTIKYHRGEMGNAHRKNSSNFKEKGGKLKIELPESWAERKKIFKIPSAYKNIGVISDIQAPFHDVEAIKVAFSYLKESKIDCLLCNGDIIDFYGLSYFQKDPRKRSFKKERLECIELLKYIKQEFNNIPIYYNLDANHERRYEKYMMNKAPEIFSTELFMVEDLLDLYSIGIIPVRGYDHIRAGKLPILHGDTLFRGIQSPVSPARTVFMKLKKSCLASHVHKVSQYTWVDLDGQTYSTYTMGCLMNLNVEYNPHGNDYVHGVVRIELDEKGNYKVHNRLILNGAVH